jgi:prostaglandin-E synthase
MMANAARHPTVLYAQDKKNIFLTIDLQDIGDHTLNTTDSQVSFHTTKNGTAFGFEIELFDKVKKDTWHSHKTNRHIELVVEKETQDKGYWPRLQKPAGKLAFVKTDFAKWKDEDEEDEPQPYSNQDLMNEQLMMQMMQGGQMPNIDFSQTGGDVDSDDEDLPEDEEK